MLFEWIQFCALIGLCAIFVPLMGAYMSKVFRGEATFLHPVLYPIEKLSYRIGGINPDYEMTWKKYAQALFLFNLMGFLALFLILILQKYLPFNPQKFESPSWDLALNTAISFVTNTNWQAYSGETTLSYTAQMCGLTVQNFLSAATGNAVLLALIRGISRKTTHGIGNFWVDLVRTVIYLLIPLSIVVALILISQGVIQTLAPYVQATTLENLIQTIPLGPVASQVAIKQIGTNGGGFFGVNSLHPYENPTSLSNFVELLAIALIPLATTFMYGSMIGSKKHSWILLTAMVVLWSGGMGISCYAEYQNNPLLNVQPYLEGKETRIGIIPSVIWSVTTTSTSNGSVNTILTSLPPLAGGICLFNIVLGELVLGGVGVGLCSMLMFVFLTMFLSGLMVGKTPTYLGKKIEKTEMQWVSFAILMPAALILIGSGLSSVYLPTVSQLQNKGPHGLSEILYTFSSASSNNGSAFATTGFDTRFYNLSIALCMLLGRASIIIPSLAVAGSLAQKKIGSFSNSFSTDSFLFLILLIGVIILVGALTFFPVLSLGPIIEHVLMLKGQSF